MATRTISGTLLPTNNTDADFRAWVQFIEDTLVTTGAWVVTADTGQMTIASATKPGAANTKVGYRIYRMDDAMQATSPVFVRIDYGSGAAATSPGFWVTIGTGSNGSGTITNIRFNGGAVAAPTVSCTGTTTGTFNAYGSADTGRVSLGLFVNATASRIIAFVLERSKDSTGAVTADGLIMAYTTSGSQIDKSQYIVLGSATQPPNEPGLFYALSNSNPSAFGSNVGIGIHTPMKGVAQYPSNNLAIVRSSDFLAEVTITCSIYGVTRTFQHLNSLGVYQALTGAQDNTSRAAIRYD